MKQQGYHFVVAKCTEGKSYVSPTYAAQREAAKAAGLMFAAYHWLRSDSSPTAQITHLLATIGDASIPVVIDVEDSVVDGKIVSRPTLPQVVEFIDAAEAAGLRCTILYLPRSHWSKIGSPSLRPLVERTGIALCNADYGRNPQGPGSVVYPGNDSARWAPYGGVTPSLLQFSSHGEIDGYPGDVDVDAFRGTPAELRAKGWFKSYAATAPAETSLLSVATHNFGSGDGSAAVKAADLAAIAKTADVIGCQEGGDQGDAIDEFLRTHGNWHAYRPEQSVGLAAVPILYDAELLDLEGFESLQASEATRVGPDGAGPTIVKPKWANSVRLVHRPTGSLVTLVNQHAVASAQNRRIPEQERKRRRAVFSKQVSTCVEMITGLPGLVFVTADWNATPAFSLLRPLLATCVIDNAGPTHQGRQIDHVMHRSSDQVQVVSEATRRTSSDHKTVIVTYALAQQ